MRKKRFYLLSKKILEWLRRTALVSIALFIVCFLYSWMIEPNWIEVVPVQLTLPNLTSAFNGFKIVQISDIHVSHYMRQKRLDKIVGLINNQKPDIVAITGDFDTQFAPFNSKLLVAELTKINSQEIALAVLGNHDHAQHKEMGVRAALVESDVLELNNSVYTINRNGEQLSFAGIDDPYFGHPDLNQVLQQLPADGAAIALVHEPDFADQLAQTKRFDLQLSGHSHGGQVSFPVVGPLILPIGGKKYISGLSQVQDLFEYTNRGVGMTGIPIRFNSRPEITVFTLLTDITQNNEKSMVLTSHEKSSINLFPFSP